ncbi:protein kinase domain-containing protein [Kineococcus aurantiacus]|uniref:Serine/threonine protein kinase n=2 Tax=Kineococcus aurantiacus TaxID=37633 RepID=A0A7Y9ATJ1_9ACTN|nr:serine/threonine protein kinase [Kineococcus aurantiacus]
MTLPDPHAVPRDTRPDTDAPTGPAGPARQWRRAALAALGDDPRRRPPLVDGYDVDALLGAGGSSVVWSATGVDGVQRALKVLAPGADADLLAELSTLRRVRHPRVVAVHDISTTADGRPVLVLDLAAGGSLSAVLAQRRRLSAGEVSGVLGVLGPALEDLHAAGVVHGDLSPGNVLLDAAGEPLLADLGVSRALGRRHGSVLGTPGFADPAAVAGEGVGAASDVYGLAALAWCALTGAPPAPAGAVGHRLAHRRALGDLPPGNAAAVLAAVREGLHRKPSRRPTPGELATAVAAAARPRPVRGLAAGAAAAGAPARVPPPPAATRRMGSGSPVVAEPPASARPAPSSGSTPSRRTPSRPTPRRTPSRATRRRVRPGLLVAGALPVAAVALVVLWRSTTPAPASLAAPLPAPAAAPAAAPVAAPVAGEPAAPSVAPARPTGPASADGALPAVPADGADVLRGEDAVAVVAELADRRARALTAGSAQALDLVDSPGSPARTADEALLAELAAGGSRFEALGFDVTAVRQVERDGDRWVLDADVTTAEHVVVSAAGARRTVPTGEPRASRLTLERVGGQWRVSAVG